MQRIENDKASLLPSDLKFKWPLGYNYPVVDVSYNPTDGKYEHFRSLKLIPTDAIGLTKRKHGKVLEQQLKDGPDGKKSVYKVSAPMQGSDKTTWVPEQAVKVFPIGWPCEIVRDYDHPDRRGHLRVNKGDRGVIVGFRIPDAALKKDQGGERDDLLLFRVTMIDSGIHTHSQALETGQLPRYVLRIGTANAYGLHSITGAIPRNFDPSGFSTTQLSQYRGCHFADAICGLSDAYAQNINNFGAASSAIRDVWSDNQMRAFFNNLIIQGCYTARGQAFYDGNRFTAEDLRALPEAVADCPMIYGVIYWWNNPDGSIRKFCIKIGKTRNSTIRNSSYLTAEAAGDQFHYNLVSGCDGRKMVELCRVVEGVAQTLGEDYLAHAFGSFIPFVLSESITDEDNQITTQLAEDESQEQFQIETSENAVAQEKSQGRKSTMAMKANSQLCNKIATGVFDNLQFIPFCRRVQVASGLNYQPPIFEHPLTKRVVKLMRRDGIGSLYGMAPAKLLTKGEQCRIKLGSTDLLFSLDTDSVQAGDLVYPCFELTPPGTDHPTPYVRVGKLANWVGYEQVRRFGLRIEYWDRRTKKYVRCRIQRKLNFKGLQQPDAPPTSAIYDGIFALVCSIEQIYTTADLPTYRRAPLNDCIVRQDFDHLTQTYSIIDISLPKVPGPADRYRDLGEITTSLVQLGLSTNYAPRGNNKREADCDYCYYLSEGDREDMAADSQAACRPLLLPGPPGVQVFQCLNCKILGRPCTWTAQSMFQEGSDKYKAIMPPPRATKADLEFVDAPRQILIRRTA